MSKQLSLSIDTFQREEIRRLIAYVSYSYLETYKVHPDADSNDYGYGYTSTRPRTEQTELKLGLVLDDAGMREIKDNFEKIQEKVKQYILFDKRYLAELVVNSVDLKYKTLSVFSLDYLMNIEL